MIFLFLKRDTHGNVDYITVSIKKEKNNGRTKN